MLVDVCFHDWLEQNHRENQVGRDLWRSFRSTSAQSRLTCLLPTFLYISLGDLNLQGLRKDEKGKSEEPFTLSSVKVKVLSLDLGRLMLSPRAVHSNIRYDGLINWFISINPKPRNTAFTKSRNITWSLPEPQLPSPSCLSLHHARWFLSAWVSVRKQMFLSQLHFWSTSHILWRFLSQVGKKKTKHQNKTESKRQFSNLRSWHKTKLVFSPPLSLFVSHCSERFSWYFLCLSPLPI